MRQEQAAQERVLEYWRIRKPKGEKVMIGNSAALAKSMLKSW